MHRLHRPSRKTYASYSYVEPKLLRNDEGDEDDEDDDYFFTATRLAPSRRAAHRKGASTQPTRAAAARKSRGSARTRTRTRAYPPPTAQPAATRATTRHAKPPHRGNLQKPTPRPAARKNAQPYA